MKRTVCLTVAGLASLAALLRWTPLGDRLRRGWSTVVRQERHR